jgi:hypothetical protein
MKGTIMALRRSLSAMGIQTPLQPFKFYVTPRGVDPVLSAVHLIGAMFRVHATNDRSYRRYSPAHLSDLERIKEWGAPRLYTISRVVYSGDYETELDVQLRITELVHSIKEPIYFIQFELADGTYTFPRPYSAVKPVGEFDFTMSVRIRRAFFSNSKVSMGAVERNELTLDLGLRKYKDIAKRVEKVLTPCGEQAVLQVEIAGKLRITLAPYHERITNDYCEDL